MLSEIDILKEELDRMVQKESPYSDIYHLSCKIDKLLVDYYSKHECIEKLFLRK